MRGLSPVAASGGHSSSWCAGLSLSRPLPLRSTGSRRAGSVVVAHGPNCSAARGIFPDQGSNPCPLHWQADSQPLRPQGSPNLSFLILKNCKKSRVPTAVCNTENLMQTFVNMNSYGQKHKLLPPLMANPLCQAVLHSAFLV